MRKKWTYWRRAVISLLCVISCLPWGQLPAAAEPDMPEVLEETWKQNDGLLVPANEPAGCLRITIERLSDAARQITIEGDERFADLGD